ncbi:CheR family methyltransferase [Haliangium sp.]|uniref:CheR family methyltransferase n=1 Tax=Haliangium sp. TaxID=2663208 RepID=UPI003D0CE69D
MSRQDVEQIEIALLLEAVRRRYGYDFSEHAPASLRRRILHRMQQSGLSTISEMIPLLLHDQSYFDELLHSFSITVTEMFRDPPFFRAIRDVVIPILRTYPFTKVWHAGCASGEEVYSMAILLQEEGIYERALLYGTDYNKQALAKAKEGIYPLDALDAYAKSYREAGGKRSLFDYFHVRHGFAKIKRSVQENILFTYHNLLADGVFGEMNMIICRNVLIYFNRNLQDRVIRLFLDSLCHRGFICLGSKETIATSPLRTELEEVCAKERIYRGVAAARRERS